MEHLKFWVNNLLNYIESNIDEDYGKKMIENCGRICANDCGAVKEVNEIRVYVTIPDMMIR